MEFFFIFVFVFAVSSASNVPFIDLTEPPSPIIGVTLKRKDRDYDNEQTTYSLPAIGHPSTITPEYLISQGLNHNQDFQDQRDFYRTHNRSLVQQIKHLLSQGIGMYDDDLIPDDALFYYQLEIFSNLLMDYIAEMLIDDQVEEEAKYLTSVLKLFKIND